ncbi:SCO2522 family protein [Nocardia sp. NPDC046473]|uniref:SCO2522 family protein n=1 Tax=Nocardia sp. NPDC046473 TaxID=3155733 RepID=UPI0033D48DA7
MGEALLTMNGATMYSEADEQVQVAGVKFAHLSIETGHFYMKSLLDGEDKIRAHFERVTRLVELHTKEAELEYGPSARVSTCFLIDDYFGSNTNPTEVLDKVLGIAEKCGLRIDYLAREAGCWETPQYVDKRLTGQQIPLAEMVASWVVAEPLKQTTGRRPPDVESGWLCNGRRSSEHDSEQAMQVVEYRRPEEFASREHTIFLDIELWNTRTNKDGEEHTRWSCPFLASIWQLLRLGMLRYEGKAVVVPQPRPEHWPASWWEMPSVIALNPHAAPFQAYRALSILPREYVKIEHAVQTILDHIVIDPEVLQKAVERADGEGITIPREVTGRLSHMFVDEVAKRPRADEA